MEGCGLAMAYSDDLIEQAEGLASRDRRRPKQASLRRAVSTAYYALFHEIVDQAAGSILSNADASGPIGDRLRRVIRHDAVLSASKWFTGVPMPSVIREMRGGADAPPVEPRFAQVCQLFGDLQAERHTADYNLSAPFVPGETIRRVAEARLPSHRCGESSQEVTSSFFSWAACSALA